MALIEIKNLTKKFTQKDDEIVALNHINISIEKADIYGIIGMSGAGKSTLVRCLNYLESPTEGDVVIDGKVLGTLNEKELRAQRSEIGMIFQHFNLLMQKSVIDNVCFPLRLKKVSKKEAREKALELLKIVDLESKANAYPSQLSGGQKQRVAIARALASSPKILLCDEATSALDPQTTESILKLLKQINEDMGITIVIITHQMNVVSEICNKVAIIESGNLVENGSVDEIFAHPKSQAAKKLIYGENTGDKYIGSLNDSNTNQMEGISDYYEKDGIDMNIGKKIRIVFSDNSAFEPVIANMIIHFNAPVNILKADTKEVGGKAVGEMILGLPKDKHLQIDMENYLLEHGVKIQEV
ncbi:MAG: ATP-binding cassette domain-containing protein [Lachnospiraceae bacterium]|nr:ATP-binding cassette domain-containing protein [Lachnospiraceae bacterium]